MSHEQSARAHHHSAWMVASLWVILSTLILRFSTSIKSIFIARTFSKEEVGVVSVILFLHMGIQALTEVGHESALIQRREEHLTRAMNTAWVAAVARGAALCLAFVVSAPYVSDFYRQPLLSPMIQASGLYFLIVGFQNTHQVKLIREMDFFYPKMLKSLGGVVEVLVTLGVGLYYQSIWCVVFGGLSFHLIQTIGSHIISPKGLKVEFSLSDLKELFKFGVHIQLISMMVFVITQVDNAVIGRVLSLEQLAVYTNAYLISNLPATQIVSTSAQITYPMWSKVCREGDVTRRNQMFLKTVLLTMSLCAALAVGIYAGGGDLIEVIYGEGWRQAETPLRVLVISTIWRAFGSTCGPLFKAIGQPKVMTIEISFKSALVLILIYPLTKAYGMTGAAWAVTLPMLVVTPFALMRYFHLANIELRDVVSVMTKPTLVYGGALTLWLLLEASSLTPTSLYMRGVWLPLALTLSSLLLHIGVDKSLRDILSSTFKRAERSPLIDP